MSNGSYHRYFIEEVGFVEANRGLTRRYEDYIYKMSLESSIQQVSLKEDVCWATVSASMSNTSIAKCRHVAMAGVW